MSYLENNEAFLGTGDRNSKGQTLEEFLAAYNPRLKAISQSKPVMMLLMQLGLR
jgi:hypothetical protein